MTIFPKNVHTLVYYGPTLSDEAALVIGSSAGLGLSVLAVRAGSGGLARQAAALVALGGREHCRLARIIADCGWLFTRLRVRCNKPSPLQNPAHCQLPTLRCKNI